MKQATKLRSHMVVENQDSAATSIRRVSIGINHLPPDAGIPSVHTRTCQDFEAACRAGLNIGGSGVEPLQSPPMAHKAPCTPKWAPRIDGNARRMCLHFAETAQLA